MSQTSWLVCTDKYFLPFWLEQAVWVRSKTPKNAICRCPPYPILSRRTGYKGQWHRFFLRQPNVVDLACFFQAWAMLVLVTICFRAERWVKTRGRSEYYMNVRPRLSVRSFWRIYNTILGVTSRKKDVLRIINALREIALKKRGCRREKLFLVFESCTSRFK